MLDLGSVVNQCSGVGKSVMLATVEDRSHWLSVETTTACMLTVFRLTPPPRIF